MNTLKPKSTVTNLFAIRLQVTRDAIKIPAKIVKIITIGCNWGIIFVASLYFNNQISEIEDKYVIIATTNKINICFL